MHQSRILLLVGAVAVAAIVVVVLIVVGSNGGSSSTTTTAATSTSTTATTPTAGSIFAGVPQHGDTLGKASAAVKLTVYEDPQCPFCAQWNLQTLPTVILIVIVLIFVGSTAGGVVAVATASCLPYFTLNVIQGTKAIDADLVEMAHVYRANEATIMRSVIVPSVVPFFLAGARITLGVAWQVTLFAEYLMGVHGIGFQISGAIGLLETAEVYAWGVTVVLLTIVFEYGVFRPIERLLTRHTRRAT